jgi:HTH-type transcriptional regulator, competence development regulator
LLNVEYIINTMTSFGELLREKRRASALSQRQLAERAGVDFSYISKLENGRLPAPADDTVVRLCEILGCRSEEFFAAAKKMPTELGESLVGEPAALRFLQEASRLKLSQEEWERMLGNLHGLREGDDEGRK